MVTVNLDGFSLANRRRFAKFAKLSRYTVRHKAVAIDTDRRVVIMAINKLYQPTGGR